MCLLLHVPDLEEVLILKFVVGLLIQFCREVELFENPALDKTFQRSLAIERKVTPRGRIPQSLPYTNPHASQPSISYPLAHFPPPWTQNPTPNTTTRTPWCSFHKTTSHNSSNCRILQNLKTNKTLLTELIAPSQVEDTKEFPLENPTEVDPSLILMTQEDSNASTQPLFTHNCQIKNALALLIMDNGSQKNLVSQALVNHLNLVTTPHTQPYQLGWVQKDGPRLLVSKRCLVTFAIGQFKDTVLCDVSPLDCVDLLLGIP
jgi:hypothetical protein